MKLSVIALDYDGTIARHDRLEPSMREAIASARQRGLMVLLVTGRMLDHLRQSAGDLHFVDAVVAENGGVLHFPATGRTSTLAPPVPHGFVAELRRRGIACHAGETLVDADAGDAVRLIETIRALELPLVLIFNGGRVMAAPQGVSKATGLRAVLDALRLSARNTVAIGDAENDHELLRLAEVGVAVAWGSKALQAGADIVLPGDGPAAVARFVRELADTRSLPHPRRPRRKLVLGHTDAGQEFSLAVRGRNVLVTGDPKSGKSWVTGLLCEQLILHGYCVCVIDPEGDYASLEALPGVTLLGGEDPPPTPRDLLRALRYPDRSVVVDLSRLPHDEKMQHAGALLQALNLMRRRTGLPHRIVLDEAHYFLHEEDARHRLDLDRNGYTFVTYCPARLPAALLASTEVMIVTCESNPVELAALRDLCGGCSQTSDARWAMLPHLRVGQAVALPITEEAGGELRLFSIAPRLTPHVRHRQKYVDVPVTDYRAFVIPANGRYPSRRARTLREFVLEIERMPPEALDEYVRRGDFSRWVGEVFGDHALASDLHRLEKRHRVTASTETQSELVAAVRARYDLIDEDALAEAS